MRPWTIPILGAVALSLALPSNADARLRFGPAAVLGVLAVGAMFGGFRHSSKHHRHNASIGWPAQRARCAHRTMASCGQRASTFGARACRTDGSGTSRADGTGISRANGTDISGADGSDILAGCGG
jgi:hypothetical protein